MTPRTTSAALPILRERSDLGALRPALIREPWTGSPLSSPRPYGLSGASPPLAPPPLPKRWGGVILAQHLSANDWISFCRRDRTPPRRLLTRPFWREQRLFRGILFCFVETRLQGFDGLTQPRESDACEGRFSCQTPFLVTEHVTKPGPKKYPRDKDELSI